MFETAAYKQKRTGFYGVATSTRKHYMEDFIKEISEDIYAYCFYLGVKPHWQQKQLLDAYMEGTLNRRIAVRSGQGPGKTWASALIGTHWSLSSPMSRLIVTAPTMKQCKSAWLAQARDLIKNNTDADPRIKAIFKFMGEGYSLFGEKKDDWGCLLMTATNEEAAQGQHREYLGLICEEASGIPRALITQFKGTLSNAGGKSMHLMIGNPNTRTCAFFDCFHMLADKWIKIHWNSEETPESEHFSSVRNTEIAEEFGEDSDVYRVRVKGEFPHTDPACLINEDDLIACTKVEAKAKALAVNVKMKPVRKQIGIDLARYGGDENVISIFSGNLMLKMECYQRTSPARAIDRAVLLQENMDWKTDDCMYIVDTSGMGELAADVMGSQRRMGRRLHEFYTQNSAHESDKYANKMTEAWCLFAKEVRKHQIYLKYDKKLFQQLANRLYMVDKNGKIKIETKDEYKKRNKDVSDGDLGQSPDRADSVVMGHYPHGVESTRVVTA